MPGYYPVFLNISGRKCVVVGGGRVALRKVRMILDCGAVVEVISPDFCSELVQLAESGKIRAINREYRDGDLKSAFMAIAATDDKATNLKIVRETRARRVLVNVVDDSENSDFIVPSSLRRGDITIAISTAGKSPALARKLRTKLEKELGDEYALLAQLIGEVRAEAKQLGLKVDGDQWQEALDLDSLIKLLQKGEMEKARAVLLNSLRQRSEVKR